MSSVRSTQGMGVPARLRKILWLVAALSVPGAGHAQVSTNITSSGFTTSVPSAPPAGGVYDITGGTRPSNGPNLFHSFQTFSVGSGDVAGGIGPAPEGDGNGHAMFYVGVEDVEASLQKAESLGGKRIFGPMEVPDGPTIAHFADPEGHLVGLFARM